MLYWVGTEFPQSQSMQLAFWVCELQINNPPDYEFPLLRTDLVALDRTVEAMAKRDFGTFIAVVADELPSDAVDVEEAVLADTRYDCSAE